jgi:hypothetical protein
VRPRDSRKSAWPFQSPASSGGTSTAAPRRGAPRRSGLGGRSGRGPLGGRSALGAPRSPRGAGAGCPDGALVGPEPAAEGAGRRPERGLGALGLADRAGGLAEEDVPVSAAVGRRSFSEVFDTAIDWGHPRRVRCGRWRVRGVPRTVGRGRLPAGASERHPPPPARPAEPPRTDRPRRQSRWFDTAYRGGTAGLRRRRAGGW